MSKIFLIALLFIAVGYIFETRRRSSMKALAKPAQLPGAGGESGSYVTADEAGPTETGKFRVEKLLAKSQLRPGSPVKSVDVSEASADEITEGEDGALPDPFEPK